MLSRTLLAIVSTLVGCVCANVEKAIFLAPERANLPRDASIDTLLLVPLSPQRATARTYLNATFPTDDYPKGTQTWMLLDGLTPGARYEVRICWLATQPTAFSIYTHTITETFQNSDLLSSLSAFSYARQADLDDLAIQKLTDRKWKPASVTDQSSSSLLFLQIFVAADYFSLNRTLMETVPPVLVDVILDQYLLKVFPKSLVPTAGYILILAVLSWFVSGFIWAGLKGLAGSNRVDQSQDKKFK